MADKDEKDLYQNLDVLHECFMLGNTTGRKPVLGHKHVAMMLDVMDKFVEDVRDVHGDFKPDKEVLEWMVKSVHWLGKARNKFLERARDERLNNKNIQR